MKVIESETNSTLSSSSSDDEALKVKKKHHKRDKNAHKMKPSAKDESEKMSVPLDEWKAVMEFIK